MKKLVIIFYLFLATNATLAQNEIFSKETFVNTQNDTLNYRLLQPEKFKKGKKYPLVIFLHGAGERGNDNEKQLIHGGTLFSNPSNRDKYPSFVLFPQCPDNAYWPTGIRPEQGFKNGNSFVKNAPISRELNLVAQLLDEFVAKKPIDEKRIYIIGLSMGAMGTFDLVCRFPNRFAAAIAICGGVNNDRLRGFNGKTQFRIYHGDMDNVVPVEFSRDAYNTLQQTGKKVEYTEFYGVNHNSWHPAFNLSDFLSWMYKIKR